MLGSHAVVNGEIPDYSIAVGSPARVVRNRKEAWGAGCLKREIHCGAGRLRTEEGGRTAGVRGPPTTAGGARGPFARWFGRAVSRDWRGASMQLSVRAVDGTADKFHVFSCMAVW